MELGIILCASLIVLLVKTRHFRKLLPYHAWLDIAVSAFLMVAIGDSVSGFAAAVVAGLAFSIVMFLCHRTMHTQRRVKAIGPDGRAFHTWIEVPPKGLFRSE